MTTVALLPLRQGSKSIPKKNIKYIAGKPLAAWALEAAVNSSAINTVYVSTDSEEIADVIQGLGLGVQIIMRPDEFATDEASTESVMLHFMRHVEFHVLVTIQATSPFLQSQHLDFALSQFHAQRYDSMLTAVRTKRFFWNDDSKPLNYDPLHRPRRQDFAGTLMENGAFYVTQRSLLEDSQCRLGGRIGIYEMPDDCAIEIDEPSDWSIVEQQLLARKINLFNE